MSETLSEVGAAEPVAEPAAPVADPTEQLAGGEAAGAAADATAVETPAAAPAEPTLDPAELQAELEYTRGQVAQLVEYLQSQEQQPQAQMQSQPGMPDLSAFTDEFGSITPEGMVQLLALQQQQLLGAMDQRFQQISAPMEAQREEAAYNAGLESAKDMLGDNVARFGEFASDPGADQIARDRVLDRADSLLADPMFQSRYGSNPKAAEIAIQRAADEERQYLSSVMGQGAAQATNRLATLAGAASEPGAGATGAVAGVPEFKSPREVVQYYAQQARELQQQPGGTAA